MSIYDFDRMLASIQVAKEFNPDQPRDEDGKFAATGGGGEGGGGSQEWTAERLAKLRLEDPKRSPVGEAAMAKETAQLKNAKRKTYKDTADSEAAIRDYFRTTAEGAGVWGKKVQLRRELVDNYSDGSTLDRFQYKAGPIKAQAYRLHRAYDYLVITGTA